MERPEKADPAGEADSLNRTRGNARNQLSAGFPSDSRAYLGNSDYADKMQDFMTDVDTFLLKNGIATVSHVHFHNYFYAVMTPVEPTDEPTEAPTEAPTEEPKQIEEK